MKGIYNIGGVFLLMDGSGNRNATNEYEKVN